METTQQELIQMVEDLQKAIESRRKAEQTVEKLAIKRDLLEQQARMLYSIRNIIGQDIVNTMERIVRKFGLIVAYRRDIKDEVTTTTLMGVQLESLSEIISKYREQIEKAFTDEELEKARKLVEDFISTLKTALLR